MNVGNRFAALLPIRSRQERKFHQDGRRAACCPRTATGQVNASSGAPCPGEERQHGSSDPKSCRLRGSRSAGRWPAVVPRARRHHYAPDRPHRAGDQRRRSGHGRHRGRAQEPGHPVQARRSQRRRPSGDRHGVPQRHAERPAARQVPGHRPAERQPVHGRLRGDGRDRRVRGGVRCPSGRRLHLRPSRCRPELGGQPGLHGHPGRLPGPGHRLGPGRIVRVPQGHHTLRGQRPGHLGELRLPVHSEDRPARRLHLHPPGRGADTRQHRQGLAGRRVRPRRPQGTGRHLRLQPVPAAVPAAGPGHRRLDHPGRPPRLRPQLLRGPRRRRLPGRRPLGHGAEVHPR